jgi:hypothetical protein
MHLVLPKLGLALQSDQQELQELSQHFERQVVTAQVAQEQLVLVELEQVAQVPLELPQQVQLAQEFPA